MTRCGDSGRENKDIMNSISLCLSIALAGLALFAFGRAAAAQSDAPPPPLRWWKGNLHTHSLWSDGNDYPERIARSVLK